MILTRWSSFNAMVRQYDGSPDKRFACVFAPLWRFAQEIHSTQQEIRGTAIIASLFPAPEVLAQLGVTLFGRRTNGYPGPRTLDRGLQGSLSALSGPDCSISLLR